MILGYIFVYVIYHLILLSHTSNKKSWFEPLENVQTNIAHHQATNV